MKIFSTDYLESMKEDVDGGNGTGPGRPTKTMTEGGCPGHPAPLPDSDQPQEGMAGGMLIA